MNKYFLPYDVFERHKKVGSNIDSTDTVVDIGGELGHLLQFCDPKKIIVANLKTGDVIITKDKIPFKKSSFEVACAIDVLEHIPRQSRKKFVERLINIASKKVILSFPIGNKIHNDYEKKTRNWLKRKGKNIDYLDEHIKYGLPTKIEIENLIRGYKADITYSGNIHFNEILFRLFMFDPKVKFFRKISYILKKIFYFFSNEIIYLFLVNKRYSETVNRAYLIINKEQ